MEDRVLYQRFLETKTPWRVESVDLRLAAGEVHIMADEKLIERLSSGDLSHALGA